MTDDQFEKRLREQLADLASHARTTPTRSVDAGQPPGGRRRPLLLAAAALAVAIGVGVTIAINRDEPPTAVVPEDTTPTTATSTTRAPTTDGASQSAADAARDGVPAAIAALPLADRVDVQSEVASPEGRWVLSRLPDETWARFPDGIPDPDNYLGTARASAIGYGEAILLSGNGEVVKAYPMPAVPPSWLLVTDPTVYVGRIGDGGLPLSALMRIDRATLAAETVTVPPPAEGYDASWPASWHEATERDLQTYDTLVGFAPRGMTGTPATSWVGEVVVDVAGIDTFIDRVTTRRSDCPHRPPGSSPADFDGDGTYAALIDSVGLAQSAVAFDIVEWLSGQDAIDDYHLEFPDDPEGPPNDYRIRNEEPELRAASVSPDLAVWLVRLTEDSSADIDAGTLDELPTYLDDGGFGSPWWLTFEDGVITEICEQYVP